MKKEKEKNKDLNSFKKMNYVITTGSIVFTFLSFVGTVITIDLGINGGKITSAWLKFYNGDFSSIELEYVGAVLFILLVFTFFWYVIAREQHTVFYRFIKALFTHKGDYILKLRDVHYEYIDREHMNHWKNLIAQSRVEEFQFLPDRYVYSGESECVLHPSVAGQSIVLLDERDPCWKYYMIKSAKTISKGKEEKFGMKMDTIEDLNHTAKSFLSTGIYESTNELRLEVKFPQGLMPKHCKFNVYPTYTTRTAIFTMDIEPKVGANGEYILSQRIAYPVYQHKYEIDWYFEDEIAC